MVKKGTWLWIGIGSGVVLLLFIGIVSLKIISFGIALGSLVLITLIVGLALVAYLSINKTTFKKTRMNYKQTIDRIVQLVKEQKTVPLPNIEEISLIKWDKKTIFDDFSGMKITAFALLAPKQSGLGHGLWIYNYDDDDVVYESVGNRIEYLIDDLFRYYNPFKHTKTAGLSKKEVESLKNLNKRRSTILSYPIPTYFPSQEEQLKGKEVKKD